MNIKIKIKNIVRNILWPDGTYSEIPPPTEKIVQDNLADIKEVQRLIEEAQNPMEEEARRNKS